MNAPKKILFIVPDLRFGGTTSSLSNIYNSIRGNYDIQIFSLYNKKIGNFPFNDKVLQSNKFIYWYYSYISDLTGLDKFFAFLVKIIEHAALYLHINVEGYLQKKTIRQIEKKNKYDLVIGFQEGTATKFASRFSYSKKIAWIHCDYARYYSITKKNEQTTYNMFDRIICVSNFTSQSFSNIYPTLKDRVYSVYNLFDKDRVLSLSSEKIVDANFKNDCFTILSVGRIDSVKRYSEIPAIASKLQKLGDKFRWYIIGNIVEQDEHDKLVANINKYKVNGIVVPLGGRSNPYPYFAKSDLFVSTSISEACPMVFIEAQILRLPIVSTNFGSSFEFIENGVNGLIENLSNLHEPIHKVIKRKCIARSSSSVICNNSIKNQINNIINELLAEN